MIRVMSMGFSKIMLIIDCQPTIKSKKFSSVPFWSRNVVDFTISIVDYIHHE